jgi:phosphoribosyl-ATP pyrophosphohydrolase
MTFDNIRLWAEKRGLLFKENSFKQVSKITEELGEVAQCLNKQQPEKLKEELGDLVFSATILAAQNGYKIEDCIQFVIDKNEGREGEIINGLFIRK